MGQEVLLKLVDLGGTFVIAGGLVWLIAMKLDGLSKRLDRLVDRIEELVHVSAEGC